MNISIYLLIIIAINVICSLKGFKDRSFFETYKFNVGGVKRGEKLRLLVSGFLHVDLQHLLFNMVTLYFFANNVLASVGPLYFFLIYFGSLIFGNLLSYYFHQNESYYSAVGASGAVTGILMLLYCYTQACQCIYILSPFLFRPMSLGLGICCILFTE